MRNVSTISHLQISKIGESIVITLPICMFHYCHLWNHRSRQRPADHRMPAGCTGSDPCNS